MLNVSSITKFRPFNANFSRGTGKIQLQNPLPKPTVCRSIVVKEKPTFDFPVF
jgi:hypothetical protein